MSNLQNAAGANKQVLHNVYFEGKVQSLELETDEGRATVGVMKKGTYQFSTSSTEKIMVIAGTINTKFDGEEWVAHHQHESFVVDTNVVFDVVVDSDVAYICYYKD